MYIAVMNTKMKQKEQLARFTNDFALNAQLGFTEARQLRLFLALVSQTNPQDPDEEMKGILSIKDIAQLIMKKGAKKSGNIYKEIGEFIDKMMNSNSVKFAPSVDIVDKKVRKYLKDYGVVFDRIKLIQEGGSSFYEYRFHKDMRPHLKRLKQNFVSLSVPRGMRSGHAIRFLVLAKAHHDKYRNGGKVRVTEKTIAIADLKRILGIEKKYSVISDLKKRVINPIISEINQSGFLNIPYHDYLRTGRSISHIIFQFEDGELYKREEQKNLELSNIDNKKINTSKLVKNNFVPSKENEESLKTYQFIAYQYLVERKIEKGIAYRQLVLVIPSSEFLGFEDLYFRFVWEKFEKETKYKQPKRKAGAFVKWYMQGEFKNRHFSEIMEKVNKEKKRLQSDEPKRWINRNAVKNMLHKEFVVWLKNEQNKAKRKPQEIVMSQKVNKIITTPNIEQKERKHKHDVERMFPEIKTDKAVKFDFQKFQQQHTKEYQRIREEVLEELKPFYEGRKMKQQDIQKLLSSTLPNRCEIWYNTYKR